MSKGILRQQVLQVLSKMDRKKRQAYQEKLFDALTDYIQDYSYQKIGLYWGLVPEIETSKLILSLLNQGISVYLVRMEASRHLSFRAFTGVSDLEQTSFGIYQPKATCPDLCPEDLDLMVVPGLVFTPSGYRIGFGGGYYDRLLSQYPYLETLSLAFPDQVKAEDSWFIEDHDIPVNRLLTLNDEGRTVLL